MYSYTRKLILHAHIKINKQLYLKNTHTSYLEEDPRVGRNVDEIVNNNKLIEIQLK